MTWSGHTCWQKSWLDAPESVPGVRLVCDARVSLFSTDFRPMQVTEARAKALDVRHM